MADYSLSMLRRVWWFLMGTMVGAAGSAYVVTRLARARKALTPASLRRYAVRSLADALDGMGTRLRSPNGQS